MKKGALRPPKVKFALLFLVLRHILMSSESCIDLQNYVKKMTNISMGSRVFMFRLFVCLFLIFTHLLNVS